MRFASAVVAAAFAVVPPPSPVVLLWSEQQQQQQQQQQATIIIPKSATQVSTMSSTAPFFSSSSTFFLSSSSSSLSVSSSSSLLEQGVASWIATTTAVTSQEQQQQQQQQQRQPEPPSKADVLLLRQAFAEFYGPNRDLVKSEQLLTRAIQVWEQKEQPPDEVAALYRVRGDCYSALAEDATKAIADYTQAITLLQLSSQSEEQDEYAGGAKADATELPDALLGRARARKSLLSPGIGVGGVDVDVSKRENQQKELATAAAADYRQALFLSSREEWDTELECIEDGASRNPYATWEWGTVLRRAGQLQEAAQAHALAANAFEEIGDRARSVISLLDAGIDLAAVAAAATTSADSTAAAGASASYDEAVSVLTKAIGKTKGVEGRDVALLQRVIAKEGEGRMALAALLWNHGQRAKAETSLGDACIRLEQMQADDAALQQLQQQQRKGTNTQLQQPRRLKFSMDDDIAPLEVSCFRFKNPTFLSERLGWPPALQQQVIQLELLR